MLSGGLKFFEQLVRTKNPPLERVFNFSREDRIRTCDHMTPSHVRYRAALLPAQYPLTGMQM
jgi:hypothetical protein